MCLVNKYVLIIKSGLLRPKDFLYKGFVIISSVAKILYMKQNNTMHPSLIIGKFHTMVIQSDNGIIWWSFTNIQGQNMCQIYSNKSIPYNMNEISYNALTTSNCPKAIYMETRGSIWFWYWKYTELVQTLWYMLLKYHLMQFQYDY